VSYSFNPNKLDLIKIKERVIAVGELKLSLSLDLKMILILTFLVGGEESSATKATLVKHV